MNDARRRIRQSLSAQCDGHAEAGELNVIISDRKTVSGKEKNRRRTSTETRNASENSKEPQLCPHCLTDG